MTTIQERTWDFFGEFQTLQSPLCLDELKQVNDKLIETIKSLVISKRPNNYEMDEMDDPTDAPIVNQIIYEIYGIFEVTNNKLKQINFTTNYNTGLDRLTTIIEKTYKDKDGIWYDNLLQIMRLATEELRLINDDPESIWKNINNKKEHLSVIYRTTTKMNCPECNASVFINSYLKTHKGSKKCFLATQPKPPKKQATDKIKCCEGCPKEVCYSNLSRMNTHRKICDIYNSRLSSSVI